MSRSRGPRGARARHGARFGLAWLLLGVARLAVRLVPFPRLARLLGSPGEDPVAPPVPVAAAGRARWIGAATSRAAERTPWQSECLPQALAVGVQLRLVGIPHTTSFGMQRRDGALTAHAWVSVGGHSVVGGDPSGHAEVATYSWPPGRPSREG